MSDRLRVLTLCAVDSTLVVLMWAQLRAMRVAGYEVWTASSPGPNRQWLEEQGVRYHPFDIRRAISPMADLRTLWRLIRFMRRERITIVHTHTAKAALLGQLAAKIAGVPVIINTLHGFYFDEDMHWLKKQFYVMMAFIGSRCADMTLSQNQDDIDAAVRLKICSNKRVRFLGNGIDLSRFSPERFDNGFRDRKRKELGLPTDKKLVLMAARLVEDKGFLEMFEAVKRLSAHRDDFRYVFIGVEETYRGGAIPAGVYERYGIESHTIRMAPRGDMDELMAAVDIMVLPSRRREGVPRSLIEAAASSLPIVTTNTRGCRDVVEDGVSGFLIPPKDSDALANAIEKLLDDDDLRKRMGDAGRQFAVRKFDENLICERVLAVYEELLKAKGRGTPAPAEELDEHLPRKAPCAW